MEIEPQSSVERTEAISHTALCSVRIHTAFGNDLYVLEKTDRLRLVPLTCRPTEYAANSVRYDINNLFQKKLEPLVHDFHEKRYPSPYFSATYEGPKSDENGEQYDVFSIHLDYNVSIWLMTHPFILRDLNLIVVSKQEIENHINNQRMYQITKPNIGLGHLTIDPQCKNILLPVPETTQITNTEKWKRRMMRNVLNFFQTEVDYKLQDDDFNRLKKFVDPKIVKSLRESTIKRRLMEKMLMFVQGLFEGLTVYRIQTQQPDRFNISNFILIIGLILTEATAEYFEKQAQKSALTDLKPIVDFLKKRYQPDARMHGMTRTELSNQLDYILSSLAEGEGIPSQLDETMMSTFLISSALALSRNYQLMSLILGTSIGLALYLRLLIKANPFQATGSMLHPISHFISTFGRYLPALANASGLNLREVAIISMMAGYHTENLSNLSDMHAARASLLLLRELLRMFDLSINTQKLWVEHCKRLKEKYPSSSSTIQTAVQKLQKNLLVQCYLLISV